MPKIKIDKDQCKGCQLCIFFCPKKLIKLDKNLNKRGVRAAIFEGKDECAGCTFCALMCPESCIEVFV